MRPLDLALYTIGTVAGLYIMGAAWMIVMAFQAVLAAESTRAIFGDVDERTAGCFSHRNRITSEGE
jgi:hypothetical protein